MSSEINKLKVIRDNAVSKEGEIFDMVSQSSLGKGLSEIFNDLSQYGECNIEINNWLKVNLLIKPIECKMQCLPFHSLLFKENPKRLETCIIDKSQTSVLNILVKRCKYPIASFKDISDEEGISFKALYDGALHFIRWNKARTIPCVTLHSIFVNHREFRYNTALVKEWEKTFKQREEDFIKTLIVFSSPKQIKDVDIGFSGKNKMFAIVTWLLRKNVIIDMHYHIYLFLGRPLPKTKYYEESEEILEKFNDGSREFQSLKSIYKYCTGNTIVEEIIANTSQSLEDIIKCSHRFKSILKMVML